MNAEFTPADAGSRRRISNSLDENLFVEAGAGTGKTTAMVARIVNLIKKGRTTIGRIAAITFTELAAAELRDKVRHELEKSAADSTADASERGRCIEATRGMDGASIQTLHSFAGALLREKPLEAGLPPNFSICDEIEADIRFEEKWQEWLQILQESPASAELLRLLNFGLKPDNLREIAMALHYNYDLLTVPVPAPPPPPRAAVKELIDALPLLRRLGALCTDPEDKMLAHLDRVVQLAEWLSELDPGSDYALNVLRRSRGFAADRVGRKGNWGDGAALADLREKLQELQELRQAEMEAIRQAGLAVLLEQLRLLVLAYVEERRAMGRAEFHDLLVWARGLLRDDPSVRRYFQDKYSHILIDEFQDTDPIQAEIAFYLASWPADGSSDPSLHGAIKRRGVALAAPETADGADLRERNWSRLALLPGKLFVVGDPKQSIYRFRRADIATVDRVRGLMAAGNAPLTHNFRSQKPVIDWVNHVFGQWMKPSPGVQAEYLALEHADLGPEAVLPQCVWRIGAQSGSKIDETRGDESRQVAMLLHHVRTAPWQVRGRDGLLRPAEFRDVCILMPTRTGLDLLERALEDGNIPYRIESQSHILGTQDVLELISCLRSIDSPADQVALVGALRSSAFTCSDVDLLQYVEAGGRLDYTLPGKGEGRVRLALEALKAYHEQRAWTPVDRLIEDFIRGQGMQQGCYGRTRPREKLRRLQMVVDLARAYAKVEGNSLRGYLDWIDRLAGERARMVESPVPDTDEDAVRIMTIHSAKGLEFPIVIMLGLNTADKSSSPTILFDKATGQLEAKTGSQVTQFKTAGYDGVLEGEEEADAAEDVRLMYVAATRARDHLVLSLWRKDEKCRAAQVLGLCLEDDPGWQEVDLSNVTLYAPGAAASPVKKPDTAEDMQSWLAERKIVVERASVPAAESVTGMLKLAKEEAEGGEAYYRTGRGGTNLGRAVHSVLQVIDLATGAGLDDLSRAQAAAEGIADKWREAAKLARNGLESPVVRRAVASGNYHREVFVSAPYEDKLLEGFMDIIFEEEGGLVIADYKTDAIDNEEELMQKKETYEQQAGLYALLANRVTGKKVKEVVLVFLRSGREIAVHPHL
ncbi:MAG: UvrD-helicase domain-containing protein [Chloroflexi bacterium]|nr:UvrD-helicase domain-containing protein [Chloroflexota bacterium]